MKLEVLTLGNTIRVLHQSLVDAKDRLKLVESDKISKVPAIAKFMVEICQQEKVKANEAILGKLNENIANLEHLLSGLCDETYPIIVLSYNKLAQVQEKKKQASLDVDDEDDYYDEEEDDEPAPKKRKSPSVSQAVAIEVQKLKLKNNKCPHGHKFGYDTEEYDDCDQCKLWNECSDKFDDNN